MKRIFLLSCFTLSVILLFGQNDKITACWNYLKPEYYDVAKAKAAIDAASLNPKTINNPKTWHLLGKTYQEIDYVCTKNPNDKLCTETPNSLDISFKAYCKALVLNFQDEKYHSLDIFNKQEDFITFAKLVNESKTRYVSSEITAEILMDKLPSLANNFVNKGAIEFKENKNYEKALENFETSFSLSQLKGTIDTAIIYYCALSSENAKMYDKAIEYYTILTNLKYGKDDSERARMYIFLANVYKEKGDTVNYEKTLEKGALAYPSDNIILKEKINNYLSKGKSKEAIDNLLVAIEKEPTNKYLLGALGTLYDELKQFDKAEEYYKKSLAVDSSYFDGIYNLGAFYFNNGADIITLANASIKDDSKYKIEKEKADEKFKKALPYLVKALNMAEEKLKNNPNDEDAKKSLKEVLKSIKSLYISLGDLVNYEAIKKRLEELK